MVRRKRHGDAAPRFHPQMVKDTATPAANLANSAPVDRIRTMRYTEASAIGQSVQRPRSKALAVRPRRSSCKAPNCSAGKWQKSWDPAGNVPRRTMR